MNTECCDVLVIGCGGAGLRAALAAKEAYPEGRVLLITKGEPGKSGVTANACSDRMAFHATLAHTEPGGPDAWKYHAEDIYRIGGEVSDGNLAAVLARGAAEAFDYLDKLGVPWVKREDGKADQFITDGSAYARACYTGPRTAVHMEEALFQEAQHQGLEIWGDTLAADLLLSDDGAVAGVLALSGDQEILLQAKAVILATGGAGEAYAVNVFPPGLTGDGYALAYRAGAELVNLEFIQIGLSSLATKLACSGSMMRALPRFINSEGKEFLKNYFPQGTDLARIRNVVFAKGASWPVSREEPSHIIDLAVFNELAAGRQVFLDFTHNPEGFKLSTLEPRWQQRYQTEMKQDVGKARRASSPLYRLREINPASIAWLREHGVAVEAGDAVEIAPAVQHFQGGVKIGPSANTSLPGLFAAGECAGGQHGANRPGGNALLDSQVFGRIAGQAAAQWAKGTVPLEPSAALVEEARSRLQQMAGGNKGLPAAAAREEIQTLASRYASVVRTAQGLEEALRRVEEIKKAGLAADDAGLPFAVETANILLTAEMVMRAARTRQESRGPHLFFAEEKDLTPLPRQDETWRRYIVISKQHDGMKLEARKPLPLQL